MKTSFESPAYMACLAGWRRSVAWFAQAGTSASQDQRDLLKASQLIEEQRRVMELVATGASLQELLDSLTVAIEKIESGTICTVMLLDERERRFLLKGSGPSLPPEYLAAIDGLEIGPTVGACGTAAFLNKTVVIEDIGSHPNFADVKDFVMSYGLHSCWSVPIRNSSNNVLGTFAMYRRQSAKPRLQELKLVEAAAQLAGNAIESLRAERHLQNSENKYRALFEDSADANWLMDETGTLDSNSAALEMFGYQVGDIMPHPPDMSPANQPDGTPSRIAAQKKIAAAFLNGTERFEWVHQRKDGSVFPAEVCLTALTLNGRQVLLATVRDITERKQAEEALLFKTMLLEAQTETTIDGILVVDESDHIVLANKQFGLSFEVPAEVLGTGDDVIVRTYVMDQIEDPEAFIAEVKYLYSRRDERSRSELRLKNGKVLDRYSAPLVDPNGQYRGRIWYFRDITDRKAAEDRIQLLAYYDALTGLPNRTLVQDRLEIALASARRHHEKVALLFLDLDRFKIYNDSLGHGFGDLLLKHVAERLKGCIREQDTVARIGGDEFLIVLNRVKDVAGAAIMAERITSEMTREFTIQGRPVSISCSLGISVFPEHGADSETLIKNADAAMYSAKDHGRNTFRFFTAEMHADALERLTLENDLRLALERKEFFLVYQPQMAIEGGEITGFEALIRWQHPERGLVLPDSFVAVAENSGLILAIGEWILRTACGQASKWQRDGLLTVPVAVNVSAAQFRQDGFLALVRNVLLETDLLPQYLELELTEGLLLSNADVSFSVLQELKDMGLKLAIDDFGTGYSSLSYLKQFPVNKLKIDRSFVRDVAVDPDDAAITIAIIRLAKSLNLRVIAEGVETEAQLSFLREHQCDEIQGYYFSKPISADEAGNMLLECPAFYVPVLMRETGQKGAEDGQGKEAYA
jgi:diguanylate cyclase (GGDEF)-like protein/PAS domain S-box-containing protein